MKKHLPIKFALCVALCAIFALAACSTLKKGLASFNDMNHPITEDIALGDQTAASIAKDVKTYPILNNASATAYVKSIMDQILNSPEIKYKNKFKYSLVLINDDKTVNAFATPGGHVYVYSGLLKFLDNDATLAGVLAHEIGHAESRHSIQRLANAGYLEKGAELAFGSNKSSTVDLATNLFSGLALLKNSRDDEYQADECSFKYLRSTKWYPGAIRLFFDKIKTNSSSYSKSLETLLSTHPLAQDRIDAVNDRIKKNNIPAPTEANLGSQSYAKFKQTLK